MERQTAIAAVLVLGLVGGLGAQTTPEVTLPASPRGLAAAQVLGSWTAGPDGAPRYSGGSWITVDYGRPLLRGRQNIFGGGAEYGKAINGGAPIWRAGANQTTRLTTQATLTIGGRTIEPGVYNVFVDLKENNWTFVMSTQPVQAKYDPSDKINLFGAYNYDAKFDVLRAAMKVSSIADVVEQFTIDFVNVATNRGTLTMAWERTRATVDFTAK